MVHPEHDEVLGFLADPRPERFSALAVRVFRHQFAHSEAWQRWCALRGVDPKFVEDWREIPPMPTAAFKYEQICCGPPQRIFRSSGTTRGAATRSAHAMPDLRLYKESAERGMRMFLFPDVENITVLSLVPSATEWPDSSLAQMISWAQERFGTSESATFATGGTLDFSGFRAALVASAASGNPVCIMTTTAAWVRFLDSCRELRWSVRLPHGSRLMDTGGDKGVPRPLSHKGLLHATWATVAIPGYFVVNEYGMSELSSQYYDDVIAHRTAGIFSPRRKRCPPWLRTRVLDPQTLTDVPAGEIGLLAHVDLANAGSAVAVLTEDLGRISDGGLELVGRAAEAELRGCSLALEEFLHT